MAISSSKKRKHAPRTEAYRAHEAFGFELGRLFDAAPHLQEPILAGIARAKLSRGELAPDLEEVKRAVLAAGERVGAVHGVPAHRASGLARSARRTRSPPRRAARAQGRQVDSQAPRNR